MRLLVVAEPQADFDKWLAAQRSSAPEPTRESERRGLAVFQSNNCVFCHQMSGAHAFGRVGPNLSHVGSRQILAAGAVTNTRDELARWIINPQHIKPGTRMPQIALKPNDLGDLLDYLESRE